MRNTIHIGVPGEIERFSFEIIDAEVPEPRPFQGPEWAVVRRMIHTTADFDLLSLVVFHQKAVSAGIAALKSGCTIVTDTEMARSGITSQRMDALGCRVICRLNDPEVRERAARMGITRSAAAVDAGLPRMDSGIWVIGNAPTALLRLLDYVDKGICRPALVVGMPVGFVNAAESKELLAGQESVPYIIIQGRKGGSAVAASVLNAIAEVARTSE